MAARAPLRVRTGASASTACIGVGAAHWQSAAASGPRGSGARHGLGPELDPRLVALLDVDLRIVIEWNSPATDLDLWVAEPSGEPAIYCVFLRAAVRCCRVSGLAGGWKRVQWRLPSTIWSCWILSLLWR